MPPKPMASIRSRLSNSPDGPERFLWGAGDSVRLDRLVNSTIFGGRVAELAGRSVLIATRDQFAAALALIELDGIARRLIVCTPDLPPEHLPAVVAKAGVDAIVSDQELKIRNSEFRIQNSKFTIGRSNRVGAAHLGHDRHAEDARPQLRGPDGTRRQRAGIG